MLSKDFVSNNMLSFDDTQGFWLFWQGTLSLHICNSIFGNYRQRKTSIFSVHVDANDTTANLLMFILKN
jgi:hypothetical protein